MSEWKPWNGGAMPVDCDEVFYKLRHGPDLELGPVRPSLLRWDHGRSPESAADPTLRRSDIVAYRVVSARPLEVRCAAQAIEAQRATTVQQGVVHDGPVREANAPTNPSRYILKMKGGKPHSFFALGRLKVGAMNKTEAAYEKDLRDAQTLGDILWYRFEGLKFRLADNTFYTPDFAVIASDGVLECHEVKGFWTDDARVKIKVAADQYPFRFKAVRAEAKKRGGGWVEEAF